MSKILENIRILELGTHIAVPKATRMLADWGAEVIKLESLKGDIWRVTGKEWDMPYTPDNAPLFETENANKKSISLNLKTEQGYKICKDLLKTADVLVTNMRLDPLKRMKLDYESLREEFPTLIYYHFTAYGNYGPDKEMPGFDIAAFWANSGILLGWISDGRPFRPFPGGFGDSACASAIMSGVLGALLHREKTGTGDYLTSSLYGTAIWMDSNGMVMGQPQYGRRYPIDREHMPNALCMIYQTGDGDWIATASSRYEYFSPLIFRLFGQEVYADDPAYVTLEGSRKHLPEVIRAIQEGYRSRSTREIVEGFTKINFVHARLKKPSEVFSDQQAWDNGYLHELTLRSGDKVVVPVSPVQFASQEFLYELSPQLGEQTKKLMEEIGYGEEQIQSFMDAGIIAAE